MMARGGVSDATETHHSATLEKKRISSLLRVIIFHPPGNWWEAGRQEMENEAMPFTTFDEYGIARFMINELTSLNTLFAVTFLFRERSRLDSLGVV